LQIFRFKIKLQLPDGLCGQAAGQGALQQIALGRFRQHGQLFRILPVFARKDVQADHLSDGQHLHSRNGVQAPFAPERIMFGKELKRKFVPLVRLDRTIAELRPGRREFVPGGEQPHRPGELRLFDELFHVIHRRLAERLAAFAGRVSDVQDDVADRAVVERARLVPARVGRQLKLPLADDAGMFERQVALIPQIRVEQAAVVLGGTSISGGSGTVKGTVIGVAIFQILSSALNLYSISPHIVDVLMGAILIFVLLVDYVIKLRKRMVRVKATDAAVKPPVSA